MMNFKRLTNKQILIFSLVFALVILSIIPLVRFFSFDSLPLGDFPYYHLRMSDNIRNNGLSSIDPLSGQSYTPDPLHILLAGLSFVIPINILSFLLPMLFGLLITFLFYKILKHQSSFKKSLILFIFVLSPPFIFTFSTLNSFALPVLLLFLGFFLIQKNSKFSVLIFTSLAFFHPLISLLSILTLLALVEGKKLRNYSITLLVLLSFFYHAFFQTKVFFILTNPLFSFVSDLGGEMGFGIFNLLLAFIGFFVVWKTYKPILAYSFFIVTIFLTVLFPQTILFLSPFFALLAGFGFLELFQMKWKIKHIRNLTVLILVYGLLFSSISFIKETSISQPTPDLINSLEWLSYQHYGKVLSHSKNGFWIEFFAERPAFSSSLYFNSVVSDEIFYSRNLAITKDLLKENNIHYILITPGMRDGLVWSSDEEGLLFLFRNQNTFKNIYFKEGIELWRVVG